MKPSSKTYFDSIARGFARQYETGDPIFRERYEVWTATIDRYLERLEGGLLCLDLGCGPGLFSLHVARRGYRTLGIDQSEVMVTLARANAQEAGLEGSLEFRIGELPVSTARDESLQNRAGLLLCSSVLEYIEDPDAFARSFRELLAPQGVALVSVPNREARYRRYERLRSRLRAKRQSCLRWHRHLFGLTEARAMLERNGLRLLEHRYLGPPPLALVFGRQPGPSVSTMILLIAELA